MVKPVPRRIPPTPEERLKIIAATTAAGSAEGITRFAKNIGVGSGASVSFGYGSGADQSNAGSNPVAPVNLAANASEAAINVHVTDDTEERFVVSGDGKQLWGDGVNTGDTNLYRSAANVLKTDDAFVSAAGTMGAGTMPEDLGLIQWNYDFLLGGAGSAATNGTVFLMRVAIRRAVTISNVHFYVSTAGSGATAGQNFAGLVNSAGVLLSSVASDTLFTTAGVRTAALGSAQAVSAGYYWVMWLANHTTPPSMLRMTNFGVVNSTGLNYGTTAATYRFASNITAQTTLGGFPITMASNNGNNQHWAAVS